MDDPIYIVVSALGGVHAVFWESTEADQWVEEQEEPDEYYIEKWIVSE